MPKILNTLLSSLVKHINYISHCQVRGKKINFSFLLHFLTMKVLRCWTHSSEITLHATVSPNSLHKYSRHRVALLCCLPASELRYFFDDHFFKIANRDRDGGLALDDACEPSTCENITEKKHMSFIQLHLTSTGVVFVLRNIHHTSMCKISLFLSCLILLLMTRTALRLHLHWQKKKDTKIK